ncbi:MAG: preprotein translocase subunit YajC [Phycisphaeraceae bacterium]|nr:preprotein translocase subunit YajC [Phycisphaeraceae bacterium]MCW5753091.1 preprotein translocase subunit YajC [Phycisphaeraceae bacterium]
MTHDPFYPAYLTLAQRGTQEGSAPPPTDTTSGGGQRGGGFDLFLPMIIVLIVMLFFMSMAGRKQRRKQQALLSNLARHDRVQTVGGIIGTIVEVRDHEVVIQVDDVSKAKIRFVKSAVQQVLKKARDGGAEETPAEVKPEALARV